MSRIGYVFVRYQSAEADPPVSPSRLTVNRQRFGADWRARHDGLLVVVHEMRAPTRWSLGEIGSLVVSTSVLPRYKIGDTILALHPPYFRCIGRDRWYTPLRYAWDEFTTFNVGRL